MKAVMYSLNMMRLPLLCLTIMTMIINSASLRAEPPEGESVEKKLDMLDLRLTFDLLSLRKDLETERRQRIDLQATIQQLQEQQFTTDHTRGSEKSEILTADLKSKPVKQFWKEDYSTQYLNQNLRNDATRLPIENREVRNDIVFLKKSFGKEKQLRKQLEKMVRDLKSQQEEMELELKQTSKQGNELSRFKSSTENLLTSLQSDLHQIEREQDVHNSSATAVTQTIDTYIEMLLNDVCNLNLSSFDACPRYGIRKTICCLKIAIHSVKETTKNNDDVHHSELRLKTGYGVSFSAGLSRSIPDIPPDATIVFDSTFYNEGNAYNTNTGIFIAPVTGTYVLFSQILGGPRALETQLIINNDIRFKLYSGDPKYLAPSSNMVVISMRRGDTARMVKNGHYGERPFYIHHMFSTFSGFLLHV